jgi:DUF971 family protein
MAESAQPAPSAIRVLREQQALELDWPDGHRSRYAAVALRWICPCAYCRGEAGLPGWLDSSPTLTEQQTTLTGGELVGSYAICIFWGDGHRTGYYTWSLLRANCACAECIGQPRGADS